MNPVLILKFVGGSVGLTGGITGSVFSSFQAFTKISIEEFFEFEWFDYTNNEDWQLLKKKLNESANTDEKNLGLTELKEVKNAKGDTNGAKVKEWCSTKKSFKSKKLLPSSFEHLLLDYVKSFCLITIEDKIEKNNKFTNSNDDLKKLKTKAEELSSHRESNGNITQEKELENIKKIESSDNRKEKALLSWCQKIYKKTYKNANDNLWKLANYYCKKTS